MLHCIHQNFPEHPRYITLITLGIWIIVYLVPQQFSWFKKLQTVLFLKLVSRASLACNKKIHALVDTGLLLL